MQEACGDSVLYEYELVQPCFQPKSAAGPGEQPAVHGTAVVGNFLHRVQLPYLLQDPRACVDPGRAAAAAGGRRRRAAGRAPAARAAVRWHREITSRCIWPGPGRAESWPYSPRC
jgi:hypothetical protein